MRTLVGLLILQKLEGLSDRKVVQAVQENRYFQFFCGVPDAERQAFMHYSGLSKFRKRLGLAGVVTLEADCFQALCELGAVDRDTLLLDSTVLEATILYPHDVGLIFKAFQKMQKVAQAHQHALWWDHVEIKRLWRTFNLTPKAVRLDWLAQFQALFVPAFALFCEQFSHETLWCQRLEQLRIQTDLKLQGARSIPDRLVSLDDVDARPIKKGKRHPSCEFGTMVQLGFSRKGFLVLSETLKGNPADKTRYQPCLELFQARLGQAPQTLVTDTGYRSRQNLSWSAEGLEHRFLGRSADVVPEQRAACRSARSATEGYVSTAKALRGLKKCRYRNLTGHRQWTLLCQIAYNLKKLALLLRAQQLPLTAMLKCAQLLV